MRETIADVMDKSSGLRLHCEKLLTDQSVLEIMVSSIDAKLEIYRSLNSASNFLDGQIPITSDPAQLSILLNHINTAHDFFETHYDYLDSSLCLQRIERLRSRACTAIRTSVTQLIDRAHRASLADVQPEGSLSSQIIYGRFQAASEQIAPLTTALQANSNSRNSEYRETLAELETHFGDCRNSLVTEKLRAHLTTQLTRIGSLATAVRQLCSQTLALAREEQLLIAACFPGSGGEATLIVLEILAQTLTNALRERIIASENIDTLRDVIETLELDFVNSKDPGPVEIISALALLRKVTQERLVFRTQTFIRSDIADRSSVKVPYPLALKTDGGIHECLRLTVTCLSKIYRAVDQTTFQALANQAVRECLSSLKTASEMAASASFDRTLFLAGHLLVLREQVAAFECDLIAYDQQVAFPGISNLLSTSASTAGFLSIFSPTISAIKFDVRASIEDELAQVCENLISSAAESILSPLASGISATSQEFLDSLVLTIPPLSARIRAYLSIGGGSASSASIIFRPIEERVNRVAEGPESEKLHETVRALFASTETLSTEKLYDLIF